MLHRFDRALRLARRLRHLGQGETLDEAQEHDLLLLLGQFPHRRAKVAPGRHLAGDVAYCADDGLLPQRLRARARAPAGNGRR